MLFSYNDNGISALSLCYKSTSSHFAWIIGFTLRYAFKKKIDN